MKIHKLYLTAFALVLAGVCGGVSAVVNAAPAPTVTNSQNTVKISPVRSDISIAPGETGAVTVRVTNLSKSKMELQVIENDFVDGNKEDGTPRLVLDADKYAPSHSLKRYMVPVKNVIIEGGKDADITVTINVPKDAKAGGYYGALRFQPVNVEGGANGGVDASAATLILLTVPGPMTEKMDVLEYNVYQGQATNSWFQSANDLSLKLRVVNMGSAHVAPMGQITVKNGDKVVDTINFNQEKPQNVVLPDGKRTWDVPLKNIGSFGHYTVEGVISYGSKNNTLNLTKSFWVIPVYVIAIAIGGTVLLVLLIVGIFLFLRSYKKRILGGGGRRGGYRR